MEEAATVRRAVIEAVRYVVPDPLREEITTFVTEGSLFPGALVLATADHLDSERFESGHDVETVDGIVELGVGVQLIYDGLRLTRDLVHGDPWTADRKPDGDMAILAADVMVARGFYLLARTEAAGCAVEVVRSFGRDQTNLEQGGDASLNDRLEVDVLELAVRAGAAGVGISLDDDAVAAFVGEYEGEVESGFGPVDGGLPEVDVDGLERGAGAAVRND